MRKEINKSINNARFTNNKEADLELKVTSGSFSRVLKYTINKPENTLKELPPSPPNSCTLGKENEGGVISAIECALVTNSTNDNCQPGARYQNLNVSDNGNNILSGITVQGPVGTDVEVELLNPAGTSYPNFFITGPGFDKTDLLGGNHKINHTISLDGRDLLILEATQQAFLRGDINGDGQVNITDIMKIVYHIMQENGIGALDLQEEDRAIYVNQGLNLPENKIQDINLNTLMGVVSIALDA